jgi:signal transduction histidine kinase
MASPFSDQFINLCRTQLDVLATNLGAEWGVVYRTAEATADLEPQLEPLCTYPETNQASPIGLTAALSLGTGPTLAAADNTYDHQGHDKTVYPVPYRRPRAHTPQKLFHPLAYEGAILGLLMAVRSDRPWSDGERYQFERMGETISLAWGLERERQWQLATLTQQQQLQTSQQQMLRNFLHQLRNPLTAIYTFSKLLLKRLPGEDANHRVAANILRESEHLKELLQQLDRSIEQAPALGDGALPLLPPAQLTVQVCDLQPLLEPLLAHGAAVAQERGLNFKVQLVEPLPPVLASASALREVLGNLLDNALKYTLEGGITTIAQIIDNQLALTIRDTGLGIPAPDLPRLFQRSYRGIQAQGQIPGTGLGLAIAKELIEQMGGGIRVHSPSAAGSGSEFIVCLPLALPGLPAGDGPK